MAMAEHRAQDQPGEGIKGMIPAGERALGVAGAGGVTLLPLGGVLLLLSGLVLAGTIVGRPGGVATPLLVIFSPVLLPAAIVIGLAVTGFIASGVLFGVTGLSWILQYLRAGIA